MSRELKLTIELIPRELWYKSLYRILNEKGQIGKWKEIKKDLFLKEGRKCWICGSLNPPFEAHEFWGYKKRKKQVLIGIHHLCSLCHKIKHFAFWTGTIQGRESLGKSGITKDDLP